MNNSHPMFVAYQGSVNEKEKALAHRLQADLIDSRELDQITPKFYLQFLRSGLCLCEFGVKAASPTCVDFYDPALHKRVADSIRSQNLVRALGLKKKPKPTVLDAMAGLGKDAYLMASAGCSVQMLERSDVVHELLKDGLERLTGLGGHEFDETLRLSHQDFLTCSFGKGDYDIVYLDPMYSLIDRKSKAKKDMDRLHGLLGPDNGDDQLFTKAADIASRRIVVKRPKNAPDFAARTPDISYRGSSARFDVYLVN